MRRIALFLILAALPALAADVSISGLPAASSVAGTDVFPTTQGSTTRKATAAQVATYTRSVTTKSDVGLGNVDNTSDATKNAAAVTLTNKTLTTPVLNSPTGLVKADVGLGNVENTALSTWAGSTNLTTLGTVATGTWNGTLIGSTYGGSGNAFFAVSGPAASTKTFTFPNASATVLTSNTPVTVAQGGTGIATGTSGGVPYFSGTTSIASSSVLAANQLLLGGGAGAAPSSLGSLGTTTTLLHGNAAGAPSYGAVSLTADVSGITPAANGGTGVNNSNTITLGGNVSTAAAFTTAGANALTLTTTGSTNVTLPTTGTLSTAAGANPTGLIGMSAVNGSATNFTRSDSTHAIDPAIVPTWTAIHKWSLAEPRLVLGESDQGSDLKGWDFDLNGGVLTGRTRTDADGAGQNWLAVTRGATTAITAVALGNATDNPSYSLLGTGSITINGAIIANKVSGGGVNSITLSSSGPVIEFNKTNAGGDAKRFFIDAFNANVFDLRMQNDAGSQSRRMQSFTRSGLTLTDIEFGNTTDNNTAHFKGSGATSFEGNVVLATAGNELQIKEGINASMGIVTLVAGTATVSTTKVTSNSRIFLTAQSLGTVTVGQGLAVSARTAATSFVITSGTPTDTSVVAWHIIEPAP